MNRRRILTLLAILSVINFSLAQSGQFIDTVFYPNDGKTIKSVVNYQIHQKDTSREGPAFYYYETGRLWQKGFHKNDKMDSLWVIFFANGQKMSK